MEGGSQSFKIRLGCLYRTEANGLHRYISSCLLLVSNGQLICKALELCQKREMIKPASFNHWIAYSGV